VFGQNKTMDSLNLALKNAKHDTTRLNLYEDLLILCETNDNLKYGNEGIMLADRLLSKSPNSKLRKQILIHKASYISYISVYYQNKNQFLTAIENTQKLFPIYSELKDTLGLEQSYTNIALYIINGGNISRAMDSLMKKLKYYEQKSNKKWAGFYLRNISRSYLISGNNNKAIEYYSKTLKINEEIGDKNESSLTIASIAEAYYNSGEFNKALEYYLKALKNYEELNNKDRLFAMNNAITSVYKDLNDTINAFKYQKNTYKMAVESGNPIKIGSSIRLLSQIYYAHGNYEKALEYGLECVEELRKSGFDEVIFNGLRTVTKIYFKLKKYQLALKYGLEAEKIAKSSLNDLNYTTNIDLLLYEIYKAKGNYEEALNHHINYMVIKDSIVNLESQSELEKKAIRYEFEKNELETKAIQEKKDAVNDEEKQQQRIILYSVSIGLFLVLLLVLFVFRGLKQKQKDNAIITQQKNEVEKSKHIIEEKHKEITDSINYAERIQKTFLASNDLLNQHLKNYFILFKPKDVVSGDFYWADTLPNGNFILATADSTGHGVPGAIMSLLNITSLEKAIEHLSDPAEILNHTRQTIINRLKRDGSAEGGKDGMDCSVIVFDFKNLQLHIAAAHNPVWIIRKRHCEGDSLKQSQTIDEIASLPRNDESLELIEIKPDKMPVGKHDRDQEGFTSHTIDIKEGDIIYTLTDGFPDQFGGDKGKKFMSKNLKELLTSNSHLSMNEQKELLNNTFTQWVGNLEQVDDVTLIGIKI
jgi:serine phosphatase RsbU (regulator of sigma subunit)